MKKKLRKKILTIETIHKFSQQRLITINVLVVCPSRPGRVKFTRNHC